MIRRTVTKYGLALHLAALAALPVALAPFHSVETRTTCLLWGALFAFLWLIFEPSVLKGEHSSSARRRVARGIFRDPLFWFFLVATVFAFVRWLNTGAAMAYDPEKSAWKVLEAAFPVLPSSVAGKGLSALATTLALGVVVCGVSHGLGLSARLCFALWTTLLTGLSGLWAGLHVCMDDLILYVRAVPPLGAWSSTGAGVFFGVFLIVAIATAMFVEARGWRAARLGYCVAVAGNGVGLVLFAPPVHSILFAPLALAGLVFGVIFLAKSASRGACVRFLVLIALGLAVPAATAGSFVPEPLRAAWQAGLDFPALWTEKLQATFAITNRISVDLWKLNPWSGSGIGSWGLHLPFLAAKADWSVLPPRLLVPLNAYCGLLAERGIVGCGVLAVGVILLLQSWGTRLAGALSIPRDDDMPALVHRVAPIAWFAPWTFLVLLPAGVLMPCLDLSAAAFAAAVPLALASASFPKKKEND